MRDVRKDGGWEGGMKGDKEEVKRFDYMWVCVCLWTFDMSAHFKKNILWLVI